MKRSAQVFLACALFSFCSFASPNISDIQAKAFQQRLWEDSYWQKILHYQKKWSGSHVSQADGKDFFLSATGWKSPKDELLTDIELLFNFEKKPDDPNLHFACKFPLRYRWLREKLQIDAPQHKELSCPDYESWHDRLGATGISLIFASGYANNPASMFGHTFLRVHRQQKNMPLPPMLHYTVNFAAETGRERGFLYTIKGLFGAYPGYFSTFPFYERVQFYNNLESRDLWEYDLKISVSDLENIVDHLWEMGSTYFSYYFADENCSYFLLALLESANENSVFLKHLPFFTIPIDTLKIVSHHSGWISDIQYRPSIRKKFEFRFRNLNTKERKIFHEIVVNHNLESAETLSSESRAETMDATIDYLLMEEKRSTKTDFQKKLLEFRSTIPISISEPEIKTPVEPIQSHPTRRIGLGGSRIAGKNFAHLDFRGAYHDLLDRSEGFDSAAQIQSMEGRIRVSLQNGDVALDHLKLIEVISLNPVAQYLTKPSWNVGFGWRKNYSNSCFDCGAFYIEGGPGFTLGNSDRRHVYFTMFGNAFFQAGPWNRTDYQIGPSGTSMILIDLIPNFRFMVSANARYSPLGEPNFIYKGLFEGALDLSKSLSLRAWTNIYRQSQEYGTSLYYYF